MKQCKKMPEPLPIGECQPGPSGLGGVRVVPLLHEKPEEPSRFYPVELSMDSEFLVPAGDGVYEIKTARQLIEEEHQEASALAKQLVSKR